ncbi:hypothetical protein M409DRAFT_59657 [Zasmidium cellare ATCC 36951]|uniref:O-methyltransferase C-terminal domain-containing protein n=1 Tax=Zasmidium cellare ATCC 36951 TaxID=1080233 RepID=A0A6A6C1E8_ZASCE|nr:uncharacterized protein M409DRAFT_59657 [Zasmidium cellare ATCC 36951]KAF2160874.1 hypothetical protein M409DRAFT_59657 [Zasmidium cellare ATCC 36951]
MSEDLLARIEVYEKTLAQEGLPKDPLVRKRLQQSAQRLSRSLEDNFDLTHRLLCSVPVELAVTRIGINMGIYRMLASSGSPVPFEKLQKSTGADPSLLSPILNALIAFKSVVDKPQSEGLAYSLPDSARYLADPIFSKAYLECMDFMVPSFTALPQKLAAEQYKSPQTDPQHAALQVAHQQEGTTIFDFLVANPDVASSFSQLMTTWGLHDPQLHEIYPIDRLQSGFESSNSDVILVDVGRIIVQDLLQIIANAPPSNLVEHQVHDFFTEQPVKGARAYYLRRVLHDWNDEEAVKTLTNLNDAMTPEYSKVLVHDHVLPDSGQEIVPVAQDITMMTLCATRERTNGSGRPCFLELG